MSATSEVTESLRRTMQLMQSELDRSVLSNTMLEQSSATLRMTGDQYSTFSNLLTTSKALITALERADFLDRILILAALIFFALVCAFIIKRRVVDKGLRIAGFATRLIPRLPKGILGKRATQEVLHMTTAFTSSVATASLSALKASQSASQAPTATSASSEEQTPAPSLVETVELSMTPVTEEESISSPTATEAASPEEPASEELPVETAAPAEHAPQETEEPEPAPLQDLHVVDSIPTAAPSSQESPSATLTAHAEPDAPEASPTLAQDDYLTFDAPSPASAVPSAETSSAVETPDPTPQASFLSSLSSEHALDDALESAISAAWTPVFGRDAHAELQEENGPEEALLDQGEVKEAEHANLFERDTTVDADSTPAETGTAKADAPMATMDAFDRATSQDQEENTIIEAVAPATETFATEETPAPALPHTVDEVDLETAMDRPAAQAGVEDGTGEPQDAAAEAEDSLVEEPDFGDSDDSGHDEL
jgi:hypothetical protein